MPDWCTPYLCCPPSFQISLSGSVAPAEYAERRADRASFDSINNLDCGFITQIGLELIASLWIQRLANLETI